MLPGADPSDRRAWLLFLTDAARPTLDKMEDLAAQTMSTAMAGVDVLAQARFVQTLSQIKQNLSGRTDDAAADEPHEARKSGSA